MVGAKEIQINKLCQELRALPPDLRAEHLERLRKARDLTLQSPNEHWQEYDSFLMALGDQDCISRNIAFYRDNSYSIEKLTATGSPIIAAMLGDDLLMENIEAGRGDVSYCGLATKAWFVMRSIILAAPEFNNELKQWVQTSPKLLLPEQASQLSGDIGIIGPLELELMRKWWRDNRIAFQAGEYSKVKLGSVWPEWKPDAPVKQASAPNATGANANPSPHEQKAAPETVATPAEDKLSVWPWFAGIAALLASVALILKRRT